MVCERRCEAEAGRSFGDEEDEAADAAAAAARGEGDDIYADGLEETSAEEEEEEEDGDGCGAPGADEDDDFLEFDPYAFIKSLPPLASIAAAAGSAGRPAILPRRTRRARGAATLVLDLDETLVHSTLGPATTSSAASRCAGSVRADFSFDVSLAGRTHGVHVRTRPHLTAFLERCAELFEVVVFTASQRVYADRLLDVVDPGRRLIRHRVFREACVVVEGNYLKDLTVLGRDMARTVIVDNSPQACHGDGGWWERGGGGCARGRKKEGGGPGPGARALPPRPPLSSFHSPPSTPSIPTPKAFGFQLENGIPIESWYDDDGDAELPRLLPLLEALATADDVRPLLASAFQLRRLVERAPSLPPFM